ncbi:MAG: hypothetical protein V4582_13540 [Pseudomonadota bacterium]
MNTDDDKWMDVLAGRAEASDGATRQAASLRAYFARQSAEELAHTPDAQGEKRLLNMLRARGAFEENTGERAKPATTRGAFARLLDWLLPPGQPHGARYAMIAAAAFALVLSPYLMRAPNSELGELEGMKSVPRLNTNANPVESEGIVMSANPRQEAAQLVALLAQAGVDASASADGDDQLVRAQVARERIGAANAKLAGIGMALPESGTLAVRFKPLR